ncbi:isochorismatase family protein [Burkholderiaceae bacterium DAT-1]|nr:isochorismatase family protein [Burkholderiaceae bacterium DAT-1]
MSQPALIVIDIQNDYFAEGAYPQWEAEAAKEAAIRAIARARTAGVPVIHVQHVADDTKGPAPFFNAGTHGVAIHPDVLAAAPDAPIVIKHHADSFRDTTLQALLQSLGVDELILCGMMTQNCVTHTAISPQADAYRKVTVLADACTAPDQIVHALALNALGVRVNVQASELIKM